MMPQKMKMNEASTKRERTSIWMDDQQLQMFALNKTQMQNKSLTTNIAKRSPQPLQMFSVLAVGWMLHIDHRFYLQQLCSAIAAAITQLSIIQRPRSLH